LITVTAKKFLNWSHSHIQFTGSAVEACPQGIWTSRDQTNSWKIKQLNDSFISVGDKTVWM